MQSKITDLAQARKGSMEQIVAECSLRIVHIITSLETGGVQSVLDHFCVSDHHNDHVVVSLNRHEPFTPDAVLPDTRRLLLAVGRLAEQKQFDQLMRAALEAPGRWR